MPTHSTRSAAALILVLASLLAACTGLERHAEAPAGAAALAPVPDLDALVLGAEMALQRGRYLEAGRAYLQAAQASEDETLAEQATRVAYEHTQWSLVQAAAARWLELNQTSEEARRFAAIAALHRYDIDAAAGHLDLLLNTAFINPQAGFLALLPQLIEEASPPAVMAVLQRLIDDFKDMTEAHYALAQTAVRADNYQLALAHARRARELGPYWAPAGMLLARVQMLRGEGAAALVTARAVMAQDDQDVYRLEYALMLMQAGEEAEGRRMLLALSDSETAGTMVERALADIDFQLGNRDAAAKRFGNLISSGQFVYESLFYLGVIAELRDQPQEAMQFYERVTAGGMAMAAQTRIARLKAKQQGLQAGLMYLQEFSASRPQFRIDAVIAQASLRTDHADSAGALELLKESLQEYPDSTELRFAQVFQLEGADQVAEAIAALRKLLADRPGDPTVENALGYTLVDRSRALREGFGLIERALARTPDNGAVLDSMGWALYRLGRPQEALQYLEHARERIDDPEVDLHLGMVLLALGRKPEAKELWHQASKRYPGDARLSRQLEKLD